MAATPATNVVAAVADALTAVTDELAQNQALNNSPALQNALAWHRLQAALDAQRAAIADEDMAAVRQLVAAPDAVPGT
jgi:hypothetical protein